MAEEIKIHSINKEDKYKELIPQLKILVETEDDLIANMANVCAALKQSFNFKTSLLKTKDCWILL